MDHTREEKDLAKQLEEQNFAGETILNQDIEWPSYTKHIGKPKEGSFLVDFCNEKEEDIDKYFGDEIQLPLVIIHAFQNISDSSVQEYLVVKIAATFEADPSRAKYFHEIKDANGDDNPFTPFFNYMKHHNEKTYAVGRAAYCLAILFRGQSKRKEELKRFLQWLMGQIQQRDEGSSHSKRNAVMALKQLLKDPEARHTFVHNRDIFVDDHSGMDILLKLLRDHSQKSDVQLLYLVCYCIWLISFQKNNHHVIENMSIVGEFTEICKTVNREKVVRVCLATLMNLVDEGKFNEVMIGAGLPKVLSSLSSRKWKDTDLIADLEKLDTKLDDKIMELSSFEMYQAEVQSGALRWGPVHTEQFWRENHSKFDDDGFDLIKPLIELLESDDPVKVQIACYDLGEFARFHPDGKRRIIQQRMKTRNGSARTAKILLMAKMNHNDPDVQKQALLAVQKLMVKNWESLASTGGVASLTSK